MSFMGKHAYGGSCLGEFTDVTAVLYTAHMYDKPSEGTGFMGQIVQKSSTCSTSYSCYMSIHIYCSLNLKSKSDTAPNAKITPSSPYLTSLRLRLASLLPLLLLLRLLFGSVSFGDLVRFFVEP